MIAESRHHGHPGEELVQLTEHRLRHVEDVLLVRGVRGAPVRGAVPSPHDEVGARLEPDHGLEGGHDEAVGRVAVVVAIWPRGGVLGGGRLEGGVTPGAKVAPCHVLVVQVQVGEVPEGAGTAGVQEQGRQEAGGQEEQKKLARTAR